MKPINKLKCFGVLTIEADNKVLQKTFFLEFKVYALEAQTTYIFLTVNCFNVKS